MRLKKLLHNSIKSLVMVLLYSLVTFVLTLYLGLPAVLQLSIMFWVVDFLETNGTNLLASLHMVRPQLR